MGFGAIMFGVSAVLGLSEGKSNRESAMKTNEYNYKVQKINNTLAYNTTLKDQIEDFKNFVDAQSKVVSEQKVTLFTGGISKKSSVFAGVKHEAESGYYEAIRKYKENLEMAENNLERANIDAEMSFVNANAQASNKYNGYSDIINSALQFYNYTNITRDTGKTVGLLGKVNEKINQATSLFGIGADDV